MEPQTQVAKLLREHGVSDNGILQIYYKQVMSDPKDRESLRNMLYWVAGFVWAHPRAPLKIPDRER